MSKRMVSLAAAGAVLFYALDRLHVSVGIWRARAAEGVPWWYVIIYFSGILAAARLLQAIDRRTRPTYRGALWLDGGSFALILVLHLLLFQHEVMLAGITCCLLAARLLVFQRPGDLPVALLVAGLDAAVELAMASASLFAYSHASLGPLPLWLMPMWAGLGLCIRGFFGAAAPAPAAEPARAAA
jgi:hypothetical protein